MTDTLSPVGHVTVVWKGWRMGGFIPLGPTSTLRLQVPALLLVIKIVIIIITIKLILKNYKSFSYFFQSSTLDKKILKIYKRILITGFCLFSNFFPHHNTTFLLPPPSSKAPHIGSSLQFHIIIVLFWSNLSKPNANKVTCISLHGKVGLFLE